MKFYICLIIALHLLSAKRFETVYYNDRFLLTETVEKVI
jgi:hypothetical protein